MKQCTDCAEPSPAYRCAECQRRFDSERMRAWRMANPDRVKEQARKDRERLLDRNPDYFRDWTARNIESERARSREVMRRDRLEHPERERARQKRYRERNLETVRARERENTYSRRAKQPYSPEVARAMASLLELPCAYCGATENITIDHIVPLARGGRHEVSNLAPACLPCNCSKNDRLLSEWPGRLTASPQPSCHE